MATSASTNHSVNRNQVVKDALTILGVIDPDESPSAQEDAIASRALNDLLKNWHGFGLMVHVSEEQSITLTADKVSYTLGPSGADVTMAKPVRVTQAFVRDSAGYDHPVDMLDRDEYFDQYDKSAGPTRVSCAYYKPDVDTGTLSVYPPANAAYASSDTLHIIYVKPYDDMDSGTNTFELPQEFYRALKYNLALDLAPMFRIPAARWSNIGVIAQQSLQLARAVYSDPVRRIRPTRF